MSIIGVVIDMGAQAYSDKERFPEGAWCKQGDYIIFRANTGTRFKINGAEYRLMNDDSIEAIVADPRGVQRAQEDIMAFEKVEYTFPDEENKKISWDEENQKWIAIDSDENSYNWDASALAWVSA